MIRNSFPVRYSTNISKAGWPEHANVYSIPSRNHHFYPKGLPTTWALGLQDAALGKSMSPQMMGPTMRQPCSYSLKPLILCVLSVCMALLLLHFLMCSWAQPGITPASGGLTSGSVPWMPSSHLILLMEESWFVLQSSACSWCFLLALLPCCLCHRPCTPLS